MSVPDESRRETLKILGAIGGTCAFPFSANELYGQQQPVTPPKQVHQHAGPPERPVAAKGRVKPGYFSEPDFAVVSQLAELIIPATDTPGAIGAGVPAYIDSVVGANKELQSIFAPGLVALNEKSRSVHGRGFLELNNEQQIELLTPWSDAVDKGRLDDAGTRFFRAIKNLTADGYYTSHTGLVEELEYKGNTVLGRFPEASVPEH
jgi:gluconate 2-dehydrogenase gamma chain